MSVSETQGHARPARRNAVGWRTPLARGVSGGLSWWQSIREKFTWWQITLLVIGCVSLVTVLSVLFFAVGDRPTTITTDAPVPAVQSAEFSTALSALVNAPLDRGGTVTILDNGDEFVPALLQSLQDAKRSINFSVYVWKAGHMADQVLPALLAAQRRGVAVRVLLDGFGSEISDKAFEPLKQAGGRVSKFRTPRLGQLTRYHRRNHRRSIVIDGNVGYTGGMAVSDAWLGHAQDPAHWRDQMFKVTGPIARGLQAGFADTWVSSIGRDSRGSRTSIPRRRPRPPPAWNGSSTSQIRRRTDHESMEYFFLLPILAARQRILLVTPYFIPDPHLSHALQEKARAGIDVRLLVPGPNNDNKLNRASSQRRYDDFLTAGIKVYEYQPTFIHSKTVVVDGAWSIIGSPNLNFRSRQLDQENAIGVLDRPFAAQLEQAFDLDVRKARRITLEEWRRRNPLARVLEWAARLIDQQS